MAPLLPDPFSIAAAAIFSGRSTKYPLGCIHNGSPSFTWHPRPYAAAGGTRVTRSLSGEPESQTKKIAVARVVLCNPGFACNLRGESNGREIFSGKDRREVAAALG